MLFGAPLRTKAQTAIRCYEVGEEGRRYVNFNEISDCRLLGPIYERDAQPLGKCLQNVSKDHLKQRTPVAGVRNMKLAFPEGPSAASGFCDL